MNDTLPRDSDIIKLHKKYASSKEVFDVVYANCLITWRIAQQLLSAKQHNLDKELIKAGCLLHDIGSYQSIAESGSLSVSAIDRGVAGEEILQGEGYSDALCSIVASHVGFGLTKEHIEETFVPLPHRNLAPQTAEGRLVSYATKLHTRSATRSGEPQFNSVKSYRLLLHNLGNNYYCDELESLVDEFGEPDLSILSEEFNQKVA